jgi:hypothetical protein
MQKVPALTQIFNHLRLPRKPRLPTAATERPMSDRDLARAIRAFQNTPAAEWTRQKLETRLRM